MKAKAQAQPKEGLQTCLRLKLKAKSTSVFQPAHFHQVKMTLKKTEKKRTAIYAGLKPAQMAVLFKTSIDGCPLVLKMKAKAQAQPKEGFTNMSKAKA